MNENQNEEQKDNKVQWWQIVLFVVGVILLFLGSMWLNETIVGLFPILGGILALGSSLNDIFHFID